jgi:polar amino acid transport system permease protein
VTAVTTWLDFIPDLIGGLGVSVRLTGVVLLLGLPLGLLLAVLTDSSSRVVRGITLAVVELGRGLPVLVLLLLIYRGAPQLDQTPGAMPSAIAAFSWSTGAYAAEIVRASLGSVPPGQMEAADALSLRRWDAFRCIVLPQAARLSIPPLMSLSIIVFQLTSLASVITVPEVMHDAYYTGSITFQYLPVFVAAAFLYAVITIPASALVARLERRLSAHL